MLYNQNNISLKDKCTGILEIYSNGMNDILESKSPQEDEPHLILILNSNKDFYSKYIKRAKRNNQIPSIANINIQHGNKYNNDDNKYSIPLNIYKPTYTSIPTVEQIYTHINETNKVLKLLRKILSKIAQSDEKLVDTFLMEYSRRKSNHIQNNNKEYYDECLKIFNHYKAKTSSIEEYKLPSISLLQNNNDSFNDDNDDVNVKNDFKFMYLHNKKKYKSIRYDFYTELSFEDYIIVLCSFIKYFTELNVKFQLFNNQIFLLIYGNEKIYEKIADKYRYDLQLKNYAYKYECDKIRKNSRNKKSSIYFQSENELTINDSEELIDYYSINNGYSYSENLISHYNNPIHFRNLQFHQLSLNNSFYFPPYFPFRIEKRGKYRTYDKNDNYHDCSNDPDFNNMFVKHCSHDCSIFRNIDKLRLINIALEQIIQFSVLSKIGLLDKVIYKQNYKAYEDKLSLSFLFRNNTQIYTSSNIMHLTNTIRNYYGEYLAFYFLWVTVFCKWIIFPSIIGSLLFVTKTLEPEILQTHFNIIGNFKLNSYEIILSMYSVIITIWASSYLKAWKQKEKMFTYIWGMEHYKNKAPTNVNFKPNKKVNFVFNEKIYTSSSFSFYYKQLISFVVIAIMIFIRVKFMLFIKNLHSENEIQTLKRTALIYSFSGTVSKIMSMIYEQIAMFLSQWENHEKYSQYETSLSFKLVMFEFFNNYLHLYYTAIYKPIAGIPCLYEDCSKEVEIQLYMILLINFSFNALELGIPLLILLLNKYKYKKEHVFINSNPHCEDNQILKMKYTTLIYEYSGRLISFGFVCLFSVVAPLTPLIVLILTFLENYVDLYKIIYLYRVELIEGSNGIEVFRGVFRMFYIVGMLTSVVIVLFTNVNIYKVMFSDKNIFDNSEFINRFLVFAILENVIFIFGGFDVNVLPTWFWHLEEFKSIYKRKYYDRKRNELPHLTNENEKQDIYF